MNTNDIIKSLGMVSPSVMPPSLIKEIHERLADGDNLQRENGKMSRQIAEDSIKLMVFNEVCQERDELRAELETAVTHIESILGQHTEATETLTAADRWLRSRQS